MARSSAPEDGVGHPKYTRRESWLPTQEQLGKDLFNPDIIEIRTEEQLKEWIQTHGHKDSLHFLRYSIVQHDSEVKTHNEMVIILYAGPLTLLQPHECK